MDEFDPDWAGDPKISTLKRKTFQAERDIVTLQQTIALETTSRINKNIIHDDYIKELQQHVLKISKENSISTLYFKSKITKEEACRLWELYASPDEENHRVADAAIEQLTKKI